ncbi:MAG TPA: antibiotic biosynthesis monooxygenase [Dehalococcoidia bacterium]|jgi:quinol monooxygenase YgiN|nr:antibiotic biosynthesis monooxygenase [Dehalococcoidia bacterium]
MAILLVQFKVQDQGKWRQAFDAHADLRKNAGCSGTHIFYNAKDPNEVIVNLQWDSEDNAATFLQSAEAQAAMAESGMIGAPQTWFLSDGGRTPS